jgi:4-hydroxybenzoate polyprenyltransferase
VALDGLFALRPLLWIPAVALFGAGSAWAGAPGDARALAALLSILGAVHAANGWRDREGDRVNRKCLPVTRGEAGRTTLLCVGAACLALATLFAWATPSGPRWLLFVTLLLGAAYVIPPLEWKRRAGLDVLSQGLGYGVVAFLLGAGPAVARDPVYAARAALPYALGVMTVSVLTMLADEPGDRTSGQRTTAVALGPRRARDLALALAWGTTFSGWIALEAVPLLWGGVAAAAISLGRVREGPGWTPVVIALQLAFLALLGPRNPMPVAFAVAAGLAVSLYNRFRWGISYPLPA